MERIRVAPGYYPDRHDPRFFNEILKYFTEVGPEQSIFPKAREDYWGNSSSYWTNLYTVAERLTSHEAQ
jgi:hypothetical protein